MDTFLHNLPRTEPAVRTDSALADVPGRSVGTGTPESDARNGETGSEPRPNIASVRHVANGGDNRTWQVPQASNNNHKPKRKRDHAKRWDGRPVYYDKPYNPARPRPISEELRAFYRDEFLL